MVRLNDDAQWIVLMGFLVSFGFFFLALVINQSTVVGQTTAESVIEFPKNDIRDMRGIIVDSINTTSVTGIRQDIKFIAFHRKNAVVEYYYKDAPGQIFYNCVGEGVYNCTDIHYNNGVTEFDERWISP